MIGAKLKIALLYDLWNEDPVAAAAKEDEIPARKSRKSIKKVKKAKTDREESSKLCRNWGMSLRISNWTGVRNLCIRSRVAMPT